MQNQNIEKYTEESPLAEEGRKLFKRLYGNAEGEAKFKLDDTQEQFVHALLQEMLYSIVQYSYIPGTYDKGYINDGCAGDVLDYGTLHNEQSFLARADDGPGCTVHYTRLGNPYTQERLYISTVYFHDIKNPETKIIRLDYEHFLSMCGRSPGSIAYKQQYEEALNVLKGQKEMPNWVPQEIKGFVVEYQLNQEALNVLKGQKEMPNWVPQEIKGFVVEYQLNHSPACRFEPAKKCLLYIISFIAKYLCSNKVENEQAHTEINKANPSNQNFQNFVTSKSEAPKDKIKQM